MQPHMHPLTSGHTPRARGGRRGATLRRGCCAATGEGSERAPGSVAAQEPGGGGLVEETHSVLVRHRHCGDHACCCAAASRGTRSRATRAGRGRGGERGQAGADSGEGRTPRMAASLLLMAGAGRGGCDGPGAADLLDGVTGLNASGSRADIPAAALGDTPDGTEQDRLSQLVGGSGAFGAGLGAGLLKNPRCQPEDTFGGSASFTFAHSFPFGATSRFSSSIHGFLAFSRFSSFSIFFFAASIWCFLFRRAWTK